MKRLTFSKTDIQAAKVLGVFFLCLAIVLGVYIHVHANPPVTHVQAPVAVVTTKPVTRADLLAAVNAERAKYGVAPLTEDPRLDSSAQQKADDEANSGYYAHVNPKTGIRGRDIAVQALNNLYGNYDENLVDLVTDISTAHAKDEWDNSPPHHNAMIDSKYTITGFGINGGLIVEHFYGPAN